LLGFSRSPPFSQLISGTVGILFTNEEPQVVIDWVDSFRKADFCRSGNIVDETFAIPAGPISLGPEEGVAPHSLEPQFRKLGLHTTLERGVPTLSNPHTVCTKGDTLNANQVQLLKLFMKPLATFQIVLLLGVNMADGSVVGGTKAEEL
jgi:mRNA turnover protein 4